MVHWSPPPTPEAYYQEAGRAGRDGDFARCVLLWRRSDTGLHRRQLDVTFPPKQLLEQLWSEPGKRVGVPKNVLESSERLRRELHPERGWLDWRPVQARRKQAETRIQAVEEYARGSGCRRARLVGYFGETLRSCRGCDRCGAMPLQRSRDPQITARLARLRAALLGQKSAWGGCPLEPEVLVRLALSPPATASALADVPGVGAAISQRLGGVILGALANDGASFIAPAPPGNDPLLESLTRWRADAARAMGVPAYMILTDAVLRSIVETRPRNPADLARIRGVGPRTLAKFGAELVRLASGESKKEVLPVVMSG